MTADATVEQIMRDVGVRVPSEPMREVASRPHNLDIGWLDSPPSGGLIWSGLAGDESCARIALICKLCPHVGLTGRPALIRGQQQALWGEPVLTLDKLEDDENIRVSRDHR
jgi:hypothetical protein